MRLSHGASFLAAFAVSFAVYLIPIFHLEAGWLLLGEALASGGDFTVRSISWLLVALLLQVVVFLTVLWLLARFSVVRIMLLLALAPFGVLIANLVLLWGIPFLLLVERDPAEEVGSLEQVCTIPDATIAQVRSGAEGSLERAEEVWLVTGDGRSRTLLRMPDCQLISLNGIFDGKTIDAVAPGGRVLHRQGSGAIGYSEPASKGFELLTEPGPITYWKPILTDDGSGLVWLNHASFEGAPKALRLHVRNLETGDERVIPIDLPGLDQLELLGASSMDGPFTLARFRNAIFAVDLNGRILKGPLSPDGIYDARWGFVWLNDGWIAWDGYREEGRRRIVWETPKGGGALSIPLGRGIDALSASPNGELIAVAISSNLRIGNVESAVFVVRTDTGEETYRRRYPEHRRLGVAFLGDEHLAIGEMETEKTQVSVHRVAETD